MIIVKYQTKLIAFSKEELDIVKTLVFLALFGGELLLCGECPDCLERYHQLRN